MEKRELSKNDVVQLKPEHKFAGMLLVVTEPKEFGCGGYLMSPRNFQAVIFRGHTFLRANFDEFEYVGILTFSEPAEEEV